MTAIKTTMYLFPRRMKNNPLKRPVSANHLPDSNQDSGEEVKFMAVRSLISNNPNFVNQAPQGLTVQWAVFSTALLAARGR